VAVARSSERDPKAPPVTATGSSATTRSDALSLRTHKRAVYERLREMIGSFELPPGERLVESDLAARLGVSKTPVREAIAMLEADGLVRTLPYRGAMVRWLSVNEMTEQGFLVDALEMPAYPIVVERITQRELAATRRVAARLKVARRAGDEGRFALLAVDIHARLFACTGFPRLQRLIGMVLGPVGLRYDRLLVYKFDDAWDLLTDLSVGRVEALYERDAELAANIVRAQRAQLQAMALARVRLPEIARYFRED
jgi:DNA-binding GntR family transcriptional regulator